MSTTIDQRVVEMRFDNSHFEKNVQTSMSTLEKLKRSLNLTGASKGLESVNTAAKNNQIGVLGSAVDQVQAKFSALQVMGVTALANITNSAVNAGKRMISALTIDPIKTGFNEYETKINSIQTIMSNTASKGTTMADVTKVIDELNTYADKTIYNFSEMTRNIGTFTAAGVGLEESAAAIQGIANLAAASGSNSQQASTAMYQLSQALAAGTVKLMDWNSVVNAGMGGEKFQEALKATARDHGVAVDDLIKKNGSFRDSLQEGWITADILNETLNKFTTKGAKEYGDAMVESGKWTREQADALLEEAKNMEDAATKVKTFTQLWDTLKESAQSGWGKTWEILFGDFEEARELFSSLSDFLGGFINKMSDVRNAILESALGKSFTGLIDKVTNVTEPVKKSAESVKDVVKSVEEYAKVVDEIIGGDWGNGQERWDKLTKAGYDWAQAQNMVNEKLGDSTRHATDYKEAQEGVAEAHSKTEKSTSAHIAKLVEMTDAQLKNAGYTKEQIDALRELEKQADKTGIPIKDFIDNIDQINGRYLLIESFKNVFGALGEVFTTVKEAWVDVFPPKSVEERAESLYNMIAALHKFTTSLGGMVDENGKLTETGDKLMRTFKGVFAVLSLVSDVLGGGLKIAFKLVSAILEHFDLNLLDVTAAIGDALVAIREATDISKLFGKALEYIVPILTNVAGEVGQWINSFLKLPVINDIIQKIKDVLTDLKNIDLTSVGKNIIDGLVNGLGGGAGRAIQAIIDIGIQILEAIKGVLGIHSPSTEFIEIGKNIIDGLVSGLQNGLSKVLSFFTDLGTKCMDLISKVDWGSVFAGGVSVGMVLMLKKMLDIFEAFSAPFSGLGSIFENTADIIKDSDKQIKKVIGGVGKVLNSFALSLKAKALKDAAVAIAILAASIVALSFIDAGKLWKSVAVIAALAVILGALAVALDKMSGSAVSIGKDGIKLGGMKTALIAIGASLLLLAATIKIIGDLDVETAIKGFVGLIALMGLMVTFFFAYGQLVKGDSAKYVGRAGTMMIKMAVALTLMVGVMKLINMLSPDEIKNGVKFILAFASFMALWSATMAGSNANISKSASMVLKITLAIGLMVGVIKLISMLSPEEMTKGVAFVAGFTAFVWALTAITKKGPEEEIHKLGGLLLAISATMLILVGVAKLINTMSWKEMGKAAVGITAFVGVIYLLIEMVKTVEKDIPKMAATLIAISVSIGILAGVSIMLSLMSISGLVKGITAVTMLGAILSLMIVATRGANDIKGSLMAMSIAIGVMAASVAALSLIKPEKLAGATIAIGSLMAVFALIAKSASNMTGAMGPLIVMTVAVGLLATIIVKLSKLPVQSAIGSATAISILLLSMSASLAILNLVKTSSVGALVALGLLTGIVAILSTILTKLSELDVQSSMANVKALSVMLLAMSGACVILAAAGAFGPAAFVGIAALATLIAGLGGVIVAIGALATEFPKLEEFLNTGIPILEKIGNALGSFFGNIISGFAEGLTSGLPQIGSDLANFMMNLQPFIDGAKSIDESAFTGINNLFKMLALIAGANIIESISSFVTGTSSMETFATQMNAFGDAIVNFSNKVSGKINEDAVLAAANAGKMLAEMQSMVSANGGVFQFFTGEKDLSVFGSQLIAFGDAIVSFSNKVSGGINEEAVTAAANAGKMLAEMQNSIVPSGGVFQFFTGEKDMATFAAQLKAFGEAISQFSTAVSSGISEEAVMAAANAGTLMAELQAKIVPTGGVVQWFSGEKDMATFGTQLVAFGSAIVGFSNAVSAGVNETAVTAAATAGSIMTELQSKILPTGGVISWFTGNTDLATFGTQLLAFGAAIVAFSEQVSGNIDEESITAAANAGTVMATLQNSIPEDKWLDGKVSLDEFGVTINKFGTQIKAFSEKISGIDSGAITTSITATKDLVSVSKSLSGIDPVGYENFKIKTLGDSIKGYSEKVSGVDIGKISSSINAMYKLRDFVNSLAGFDSSGVGSFKSAVSSLAQTNLTGMANNFAKSASQFSKAGANITDSLAKGMKSKQATLTATANSITLTLKQQFTSNMVTFQKLGSDTITRFANGIKSQNSSVSSAIRSPITSAVNTIRSYYTSFYNAGSYISAGLAAGMRSQLYQIRSAANQIANAAAQAARAKLLIKSPSRVFYGIGEFVVEGFVNALHDGNETSYKAASEMAESARTGFSSAIRSVSDLLNGEIDTQPTIRPVLDLSNIKSGAGAIDGLLGMNHSVGVMTNMNAIGSMMNGTNQNGNSEVISAIDRLRKSMGNIGGDVYNINGITYDDGSNISNAVESLVRAARIDRRS